MIELTIVNRSGRAFPRKFLETWVSKMTQAASKKIPSKKFKGKEFVIAFVTSAEIQRLNKQFRGKNKPTDVLSFESDDPGSIGELAISPEIISLQAREHGLLVREELGYMVLHGFLHLLGYDHETNKHDAKKMFLLQDSLFDALRKSHR